MRGAREPRTGHSPMPRGHLPGKVHRHDDVQRAFGAVGGAEDARDRRGGRVTARGLREMPWAASGFGLEDDLGHRRQRPLPQPGYP